MESRKEITEFVVTKKTEKSEIYKLVCQAIEVAIHVGMKRISVFEFCKYLLTEADSAEYLTKEEFLYGRRLIRDNKTKERLQINFDADHGDMCPKLRGILDLINADKEFPHFAVIVNNLIYIDDVLTGREYADRLTNRAAQLVLRVAILSEKCPLQDAPEEVDEEKSEA